MSIWYENDIEIDCDIQKIIKSFNDLSEHFLAVIRLMPGLSSVELLEHGKDFVTIRTNEGIMKRTNISMNVESERVVVEFDEEYHAGRMINVMTHYMDEFIQSGSKVMHRTVLSNVHAPGLLGFFYVKMGKSSIGNALLQSNKAFFETQIK